MKYFGPKAKFHLFQRDRDGMGMGMGGHLTST